MPYVEVQENGLTLASCYWSWVDDPLDMMWVDDGKEVPGKLRETLYIADLEVSQPRMIWKLKAKLPQSRYIVGLDDAYHIHAPKGVPKAWEAFFSLLASFAG